MTEKVFSLTMTKRLLATKAPSVSNFVPSCLRGDKRVTVKAPRPEAGASSGVARLST